MPRPLLAQMFLAVLLVCFPLTAQTVIYGWAPPLTAPPGGVGGCPSGTGGSANYCDYQANVMPNISGNTILCGWNQVDGGTTAPNYTSPGWGTCDGYFTGQGKPGSGYVQPNWTNKVVNTVISHVSNGTSNGFTPAYPYLEAWAASSAPTWTAGTVYSPNAYVIPSSPNGHFYVQVSQLQCTAGNTSPTFPITGTFVTEASGSPACSWFDVGGNAPPLDVAFCSGYPGSGSPPVNTTSNILLGTPQLTLQTGIPAIWESPYVNARQQFDAAAITHFAGVGWTSQISYVRIGGVVGGEWFPWCEAQLKGLLVPQFVESFNYSTNDYVVPPTFNGHFYKQTASSCTSGIAVPTFPTDGHSSVMSGTCTFQDTGTTAPAQLNALFEAVFTGVAASQFSYNQSQKIAAAAGFTLMAAVNFGPNNDPSWADAEAASAVANGHWLGSEALTATDLTAFAAGNPCQNDWCAIFSQYYLTVPIRESQTGGSTCPNVPTPQGVSASDCSSPATGSLYNLLPFGVQRYINVFEIFATPDLSCTYISGFSGSPTPTECTQGNYTTALTNAAAGNPPGTLSFGGNLSVTGNNTNPLTQ